MRIIRVAVVPLSCLILTACGGLWPPSHPTAVNAPTFPQPPVETPTPKEEARTPLPPVPNENSAFVLVDGVPFYRIGPDDVLELTLTRGNTQDKFQTAVQSSGNIFVLLTEVKVGGLTTDQAGAAIRQALAPYFRNPWVEVRVKEFNSKKVTVFGAVGSTIRASATSIPLTGRMTVAEAIGKAGGFHITARLNSVRVRRADGQTYVLNLFQLMQEGDLTQEFILDGGDTVFVPEEIKGQEARVFVLGEVKTPGPVPYFPNLTLAQLVAQVGGWTDNARYDEAAVIRSTPGVTEILTVDLRQLIIEGNRKIDQYLRPNDVVFIPRTRIANWNAFINQLLPTLNAINAPIQSVLSIKGIESLR